jgi:hypothetical protein
LQLFLISRISFRAIPRVLGVVSEYFGIKKIPCTQTVINWVNRLSISRIKYAHQMTTVNVTNDPFSNGFICLIDISIGLGAGKILTVLFLDAQHHKYHTSAPTLKDAHCVGVSVANSWNGETIANFLQKIIAVMGRPAAYLKDGGADLRKATRLLDECGQSSEIIDDVSHIVANLLKHKYQNHAQYSTFISACGKVSKKLKQTVLACLAPPKVSTKARFMNLHRLIDWADQLLAHLSTGEAPEGSLLEKLSLSVDQLPDCQTFIQGFSRDAHALLDCQKLLKKEGLKQSTYEECQQLIMTIPKDSTIYGGFMDWLDKQWLVSKKLGLDNIGMPISSDSLESVFGVGKSRGSGEIKDANRIGLRLPAFCGELTKADAINVVNMTIKEQNEVIGMLPSLTQQRRKQLPNPGHLDELERSSSKNLELIPRSKNRLKNEKNAVISNCYKNIVAPEIESEKSIDVSLNGELIRAACY